MLFREKSLFIVRTIHKTTALYGQNAEFWHAEAGSMYIGDWALKNIAIGLHIFRVYK
jgi:hypothetical protein